MVSTSGSQCETPVEMTPKAAPTPQKISSLKMRVHFKLRRQAAEFVAFSATTPPLVCAVVPLLPTTSPLGMPAPLSSPTPTLTPAVRPSPPAQPPHHCRRPHSQERTPDPPHSPLHSLCIPYRHSRSPNKLQGNSRECPWPWPLWASSCRVEPLPACARAP